jgi:sortase A
MNRHSLLRWLERGLLAVGAGLAVWCAMVLVEARFHNSVSVAPPLIVTQTVPPGLPGDAGRSRAQAPSATTAPAPAAGTLLGRLEAPSVRMSTAVLEGSDDATLSRGAGHIEDTPFPGQAGNIGIAGHRDTVFRPLRNIHVGDPLDLTTADRLFRYRITKTLIVGPDDVYVLDPTDRPTMTLVTCYPFDFVGHAPRRFIVQAQLVGEESRATR